MNRPFFWSLVCLFHFDGFDFCISEVHIKSAIRSRRPKPNVFANQCTTNPNGLTSERDTFGTADFANSYIRIIFPNIQLLWHRTWAESIAIRWDRHLQSLMRSFVIITFTKGIKLALGID